MRLVSWWRMWWVTHRSFVLFFSPISFRLCAFCHKTACCLNLRHSVNTCVFCCSIIYPVKWHVFIFALSFTVLNRLFWWQTFWHVIAGRAPVLPIKKCGSVPFNCLNKTCKWANMRNTRALKLSLIDQIQTLSMLWFTPALDMIGQSTNLVDW